MKVGNAGLVFLLVTVLDLTGTALLLLFIGASRFEYALLAVPPAASLWIEAGSEVNCKVDGGASRRGPCGSEVLGRPSRRPSSLRVPHVRRGRYPGFEPLE